VVLKQGPGAQKGDSAALKRLQMTQNEIKQALKLAKPAKKRLNIAKYFSSKNLENLEIKGNILSVIIKRHFIIIIYNLCIITFFICYPK